MLFDLREIYFSVWYLFNKILSKWLLDGFVSLHRQVHKDVFPKMIVFLDFTHVTFALTTVAIRHVGAQTNALKREVTVRTKA